MINKHNKYSNDNNTTSPQNNKIITLSFHDGRNLSKDIISLSKLSPIFLSKHQNSDKIPMPKWMKVEDVSTIMTIVQKGIDNIKEYNDALTLLKTSEFFQNDFFSISLLSNIIIPNISIENSLSYLLIAYQKLSDIPKNNGEIDNIWFDLLIKCLDIVGKNLSFYFNQGKLNEIEIFDAKILEELFEKFSTHLICSDKSFKNFASNENTKPSTIGSSTLNEMLSFFMKYRGHNTFFDMLTDEYMRISSEDNINELISLPNPTFLLKINISELDSYHEDYAIDIPINTKQVVFIVFYRKSDDTFNVSFKLAELCSARNQRDSDRKESSFRIITFISSVIIQEIGNRQVNIMSISNNNSMHNIYIINNVKSLLSLSYNKTQPFYITLKIFLKPCFTHSVIISFMLCNFNEFYSDKTISKVSKQLMVLILKNKNYIDIEENKIVIALINWLNDEINIKEEITEIVEYIKWDKISLDLLFEFIIKFGKNISSEDIEHIFINAFERKGNIEGNQSNKVKVFHRSIIEDLINASKKVHYTEIFSQNKRLIKQNNFNTIRFTRDSTLSSQHSGNANKIGHNNNNGYSNNNKSVSIAMERENVSIDTNVCKERKKSELRDLNEKKKNENDKQKLQLTLGIKDILIKSCSMNKIKLNMINMNSIQRNKGKVNSKGNIPRYENKSKSKEKSLNKSFVNANVNNNKKLNISNIIPLFNRNTALRKNVNNNNIKTMQNFQNNPINIKQNDIFSPINQNPIKKKSLLRQINMVKVNYHPIRTPNLKKANKTFKSFK